MLIDFQTIAHSKMRYDTCGDYFVDPKIKKLWCFRVSRMKDKRYPVLVFLHEIIEFFMCRLAGVKMKAIDKFDMEYEKTRGTTKFDRITALTRAGGGKLVQYEKKNRAQCGCEHYEEPGDDPHAPYHLQHQTATQCEKLIAKALGVDWKKYNDTVESL